LSPGRIEPLAVGRDVVAPYRDATKGGLAVVEREERTRATDAGRRSGHELDGHHPTLARRIGQTQKEQLVPARMPSRIVAPLERDQFRRARPGYGRTYTSFLPEASDPYASQRPSGENSGQPSS